MHVFLYVYGSLVVTCVELNLEEKSKHKSGDNMGVQPADIWSHVDVSRMRDVPLFFAHVHPEHEVLNHWSLGFPHDEKTSFIM